MSLEMMVSIGYLSQNSQWNFLIYSEWVDNPLLMLQGEAP